MQKPIQVDEDTWHELKIISTYKQMSIADLVRESKDLYKIKHRLNDRVEDFKR